jgi:hypothetical protein
VPHIFTDIYPSFSLLEAANAAVAFGQAETKEICGEAI